MTAASEPEALRVRRYGPRGRPVIVLHGGPGAPGCAAPLARALADPLFVLEPLQRWSSAVPLTVDQHLADLAAVIDRYAPGEEPAVVGESWGAMLALAFAAAHPARVSSLVLVGCGTFDEETRAELIENLERRMTPELVERLAALEAELPDVGDRFAEHHRLCDPLYTYHRASEREVPAEPVDFKGHLETWADMIRLQESGVYPQAFAAIRCPVLMVHGSYDPHPGTSIRDGLLRYLPQLDYRELESCGHSPWIEEHARERFLDMTRGWLEERLR